ncbi:D-tyrosyl-tRNA(Tyr) deacylase [bacterium]|nr:D-tyrosyl-tRNA(Tyr) deacylase [bacterium]
MRCVVQRVSRASVSVGGESVGAIGPGLCVLVGALEGDGPEDCAFMARKLSSLRIFTDSDGRMNLDVRAAGNAVLLVSQFTLAADTTSGTRPSFSSAMAPQAAQELLEGLKGLLEAEGLQVQTGRFGAKMDVELVNEGPVTILLDSRDKKRK